MFVLREKGVIETCSFYAGKTYVHQGEYYPCLCTLEEAKKYTSRKRAELALDALENKVGQLFEIVKLSH